MRIDKFLWCTRYYKTRTQATEACKKGRVLLNDESTKPSKEDFPGDVIKTRINQIERKLEIIAIPESRMAAKWLDQFRKDLTEADAFSNAELSTLAQKYYREKGTGRPTKKDRRDLKDYIEDQS